MAFTHTNKIRYRYTAGGTEIDQEVSKTETGGGEANVSEALGPLSSSPATPLVIDYFNYEEEYQTLSVFILLDGFDGTLKDHAGVVMLNLTDGDPFVWSKNGGTDWPMGASNPMNDNTTSLSITPVGASENDEATFTVRVLFNPRDV